MDRITLMVVPEGSAPVRRLRIPRVLLRYGPPGLLGFALAFGALASDWVRLRLDAMDLATLRARAAQDEAALAELGGRLQALEARLGRLAEFERKVRIVADLPEGGRVGGPPPARVEGAGGASPDAPPARADAARAEGGGAARTGGQGGEDEPPVAAAPQRLGLGLGLVLGVAPFGIDGLGRTPVPVGLDPAALADLRAKADGLADRSARFDEAFERLLAALVQRRERFAATPSVAPVAGWITSGFGWRTSPFTGRRQFHRGLDIAAEPGAPILATASGRVAFAGVRGPLGRTVEIDHGHGVRTTYGHAASLDVRAGQRVKRGDRLGAVGSSGRSTGPHVHYAVRVNGRPVDPSDYLLE